MSIGMKVVGDARALAEEGARRFVAGAAAAIQARDRFTALLSGGATPRRMYELLAQPTWSRQVAWEKVHFFWGDERNVPPDHPESNYRMVHEALLRAIPIPPGNVHRIRAELGDPATVARGYEADLRGFFGGSPRFDLVYLGLGDDGHTASLFPEIEIPEASADPADRAAPWVIAPWVPHLHAFRYSLTPTLINRGRDIVFLVSGRKKTPALTRILNTAATTPDAEDSRLPAQLIQPVGLEGEAAGTLTWIVDEEAMGGSGTGTA